MRKRWITIVLLLGAILLAGCGKNENREIVKEPPELVVVLGDQEITAWKGTYSWMWEEDGVGQGVCADSLHPLEVMDDLPVLNGMPGDQLMLIFGGVPDKADVICYWVEGKDLTVCPMGDMSAGGQLTLPENCAGTLWIVEGKWESGEYTGQAQYAFCLS